MSRGLRMTEQQVQKILEKRPHIHLVSGGPRPNGKKALPKPKPASYLEEMLAQHIQWAGLPEPVRQFQPLPDRRIRADFAYPAHRLLIEVTGAPHRLKERFKSDIKRTQDLVLNGWIVFPIGSEDVRLGNAVELIRKALELCQNHSTHRRHCG